MSDFTNSFHLLNSELQFYHTINCCQDDKNGLHGNSFTLNAIHSVSKENMYTTNILLAITKASVHLI